MSKNFLATYTPINLCAWNTVYRVEFLVCYAPSVVTDVPNICCNWLFAARENLGQQAELGIGVSPNRNISCLLGALYLGWGRRNPVYLLNHCDWWMLLGTKTLQTGTI